MATMSRRWAGMTLRLFLMMVLQIEIWGVWASKLFPSMTMLGPKHCRGGDLGGARLECPDVAAYAAERSGRRRSFGMASRARDVSHNGFSRGLLGFDR